MAARQNAVNLEELGDDYLGVHLRMAGIDPLEDQRVQEEARIAREKAKEEARITREKAVLVSKLFTLVSSDSNVGGLAFNIKEFNILVNHYQLLPCCEFLIRRTLGSLGGRLVSSSVLLPSVKSIPVRPFLFFTLFAVSNRLIKSL